MKKPRRGKSYSQRSERSRKRIDRLIDREGLDRGKALRDLRTGSWKPTSRKPELRKAPEIRRRESETWDTIDHVAVGLPEEHFPHDLEGMREFVKDWVANLVGDDFKFNRRGSSAYIDATPEAQLRDLVRQIGEWDELDRDSASVAFEDYARDPRNEFAVRVRSRRGSVSESRWNPLWYHSVGGRALA